MSVDKSLYHALHDLENPDCNGSCLNIKFRSNYI